MVFCLQPLALDVKHLLRAQSIIELGSASSSLQHPNACTEETVAASAAQLNSPESVHSSEKKVVDKLAAPALHQSSQSEGTSDSPSQGMPVLQVHRKHAKVAKDALKALGFLDRRCRFPAADRSDAEVALPLTPSGAAYIPAMFYSSAHPKNGLGSSASATAATDCWQRQKGNMQNGCRSSAKAGGLKTAADDSALHAYCHTLEQLIVDGLACPAHKQLVQRIGATSPGETLLVAVRSLLAGKGMHGTSPSLASTATVASLTFKA